MSWSNDWSVTHASLSHRKVWTSRNVYMCVRGLNNVMNPVWVTHPSQAQTCVKGVKCVTHTLHKYLAKSLRHFTHTLHRHLGVLLRVTHFTHSDMWEVCDLHTSLISGWVTHTLHTYQSESSVWVRCEVCDWHSSHLSGCVTHTLHSARYLESMWLTHFTHIWVCEVCEAGVKCVTYTLHKYLDEWLIHFTHSDMREVCKSHTTSQISGSVTHTLHTHQSEWSVWIHSTNIWVCYSHTSLTLICEKCVTYTIHWHLGEWLTHSTHIRVSEVCESGVK
jgi:hypothetical protein